MRGVSREKGRATKISRKLRSNNCSISHLKPTRELSVTFLLLKHIETKGGEYAEFLSYIVAGDVRGSSSRSSEH